MATRRFALVFGVVFLLVGILGFVPAALSSPAAHGAHGEHQLHVTAFDGYLLGLFHVNALHSAAHLVFGVLGLALSRSYDSARTYGKIVAVAYAALAVFGLIPGLNTLFGLLPLHGNDVWLHLLLAAVGAYFGFAKPSSRPVGTGLGTAPRVG